MPASSYSVVNLRTYIKIQIEQQHCHEFHANSSISAMSTPVCTALQDQDCNLCTEMLVKCVYVICK